MKNLSTLSTREKLCLGAAVIVFICIFFDWGNYQGFSRSQMESMIGVASSFLGSSTVSSAKTVVGADKMHALVGLLILYPAASILYDSINKKYALYVSYITFALSFLLMLCVCSSPSAVPFISTIACGVFAYGMNLLSKEAVHGMAAPQVSAPVQSALKESDVKKAIICDACGTENDPDAHFCVKCGKRLQ
jgi:ribosomal protein L40E